MQPRMSLQEAKEKAKHRTSSSVRVSTGSNLYSTVDTPGQPSQMDKSNPFDNAAPTESKQNFKPSYRLPSIVEEKSMSKELTESMELSRMLSGDSDS